MPKQHIKFRHKFITKLLISHILLASIPIIVTGIVLVGTTQKTVELNFRERSVELARHCADIINTTLHNAEKIIELNASSIFSNVKNRLSQELIVNEMINDFPIFRDIKLLDKDGKIIISTSFIKDSTQYLNNQFLAKIDKWGGGQSEVFLSEDKLPVMKIAEPILQYEEIVGILIAELNLKAMWDLIESSVIGKGAQAFVFDKAGRYIAHSERKKVYLGESFDEPEITRDVKLNQEGQRFYVNRDGEKLVAAYVSLVKLGWGVVIQQPAKEAFYVAHRMKLQILIFVTVGIALSSIIAYVYTSWIVTPVNQLVSGIDKFSAGDLRYRIPRLGNDEISMLATQFNEMAEKLQEFQDKLKKSERLATLSKLASVLSHEIKNPLNSMVINMQIMKREFNKTDPDKNKLRHYLNIVTSEIKRVDDLVNNFLLVARPPKLEKKVVTLEKVIDEIIMYQQAESLQSGVRVNRRYQKRKTEVLVDETKIKQVFLNIFLNALQAMPGGGCLIIELDEVPAKNKKNKQMVVVRFKDKGKGIKKEHLNRIFDFYFSTEENGNGLGLSVAQQIVEEHGGNIKVQSKLGEGSVFSVFLPKN